MESSSQMCTTSCHQLKTHAGGFNPINILKTQRFATCIFNFSFLQQKQVFLLRAPFVIVNGSAAYLCRYDDTGASLVNKVGIFLRWPAGSPARQVLTSALNPTIQSNRYDIKMKNSSFLCWITTKKDDSGDTQLFFFFSLIVDYKMLKLHTQKKNQTNSGAAFKLYLL